MVSPTMEMAPRIIHRVSGDGENEVYKQVLVDEMVSTEKF